MDLARYSIRHPVNVWLLVLTCLVGGLFAYFNMERLENPEFTIKQAIVTTVYPGASAEEVETEVSDALESAVQQMAQLKEVRTKSAAGYSEMRVEIRDSFRSEDIPQIWDELRRKVNDAQGQLPPGAQPSTVNDDFSDVYGIYYALTGDGLSRNELNEVAKDLRRGLITVDGVGQVEIAGAVDEQFVISIPQARLAALRIPPQEVAAALRDANRELYAGGLRSGDLFLRVSPTGAYDSIEAIRQLPVGRGESRVVLGDIATVTREPAERPDQLIRWDGKEAITLGIAGLASVNIVDVGANVDRALKRFKNRIPLGVELHPIYDQPQVVDAAVSGFALNVAESLAIVIATLCLVMGWRAGVIVGAILLLTVGGTLLAMYMLGLELERVSLAALIIAMGMLVDNAVVICDGMQVRLRQGMPALRAASESVRLTQWSLLGATIIGILAFAGIGLSQDATGEFMFSLFMVILISLLLSWVLAVSVVPLFGYHWLASSDQRREQDGEDQGEERVSGQKAAHSPYQGRLYDRFRAIVGWSLAHRRLTVGAAALLTVLCMLGFGFLPQSFFPPSSTPMAFIDIETRQGSDIRATSDAVARVEDYVRKRFPEIQHRVSFVGRGASRFVLTYVPETPDPSYGQVIVLVEKAETLEDILARFNTEAPQRFPDLQLHGERMVFGSNPEARIEARFSGPSAEVLRRLSTQARRIMEADGGLMNVRDDWQREIVLRPQLDLRRMADAGMTRQDVAQALAIATAGVQVSVLHQDDERRPLMLRAPDDERADADELLRRLVWSTGAQRYVPLAQVADGVQAVQQEAVIHRRDRQRTLAVRSEPAVGLQTNEAHMRIKEKIEAIAPPPGYSMQWGGEYEESRNAQTALMSTLALPYLGMLLVTVLLFARVRQPVVIWLVVPMAICGVTVGLAISGQPFGFVALLGLLSLTGLLIKNAIVLVQEIDRQIGEGVPRRTAVVEATISRLVPVSMAAGTTVLGMAPLLFDALFASMAVTIMGGLAFATVLTLVVVPCLYALFFRVRSDEAAEPRV